ncbi:MAG TPA: YCF48-related protein [Geminicoccaceae bacterium]|nr:YCF48-related protein [Geminicoccaceae bacterium]
MSLPEAAGRAEIISAIIALWLLAPHAAAGPAQTGSADDWAEPMPLALSSLLLDADSDGSRIIVVGERGHVLLSDDRGAHWRQVAVPTRSTLTAVRIVGGDHTWAVGHDGLILHSDDGGFSWARQRQSQEPDRPLLDVWFADPRHGMAIGAYGLLLSTEDGGRTWRDHLGSDEGAHANAIAEAPDGTLYIAGEFGSILRSDDRGRSWQRLPSPYQGSFFGLLALQDGTILVFGLRGHLFRSEDRGISWQRIETGTATTLLAGLVRADGSIVIAGLNGALLFSSEEGGRNFQLEHLSHRRGIAALIELGPDELLAVGEGGLIRISARGSAAKASMTVDTR